MNFSTESNEKLLHGLIENLRIQSDEVINKLRKCNKSITRRNETMSTMREMILCFIRKIPRKTDPMYNLNLLIASQLSKIQTAVKNVKKYFWNMIKVQHKTRDEISEVTRLCRLFSHFYLDCRRACNNLDGIYSTKNHSDKEKKYRMPRSIRKNIKKIYKLQKNLIFKTASWNQVVKLLEKKANHLSKLDEYCRVIDPDNESTLLH